MPRMGKKTLYLDLYELARIEASLRLLPGKPSLSSFLNEQFPMMADNLERMVSLVTAPSATLESIRVGLNVALDQALEDVVAAKRVIRTEDVPPKEAGLDVPAPKPKRQKKSA